MSEIVIGPEYRDALGATEGCDRHQRRKRRTRHLIYETAVRLFLAKGYDDTTMEEIAEAADVARATVFNHFPRKHRIVAYWAGLRVAPLLGLWESPAFRGRSAKEQVVGFMEELAATNERERRLAQIMMLESVRAGFPLVEEWQLIGTQAFAEAIRLGQQRGEIRDGVDPFEAGGLLRGCYLDTLYRWLQGGEKPPFPLLPTLVRKVEMVLYGICVPEPPADRNGARNGRRTRESVPA